MEGGAIRGMAGMEVMATAGMTVEMGRGGIISSPAATEAAATPTAAS